MDHRRGLIQSCLLLIFSVCVCVASGPPLGTSVLDCAVTSDKPLGTVDEGFEGDVEVFTGITAGTGVKLKSHIFEAHLEYLELVFTPGDTNATVRTKKPLDADPLIESDRTLFYSVVCTGGSEYDNVRQLTLNDLNDNSPVFTQELYSARVSETVSVDSAVLQVTAVDKDSTSENNRVTYSFAPPSEDFTLSSFGAFILKKRLNYNVAPRYDFTVTAQDNWGLSSTAAVSISVEDYDNLNPYFSHSMYQASIPENTVGTFRTIEPEAIKAQDGDHGLNVTLTYSISSVSPDTYQRNFNIDPSSGVVSVLTAVDREEMDSSVISLIIKAAQTDDALKITDTFLLVTIEDENDNRPQFDESIYSVTLQENSPADAVVFRAMVTDLDQGGFVGTLRLLPESVPFSIDSDGTVRVKDSAALDRETKDIITFQIEARETSPPNHFEVVEVRVTLLDENDNSPAFTSNKYEGQVFSNQTEGMLLVQVEAEDPDVDANGQIKYSIDFGNDDGYFSIDEDTGEVTLVKIIPLVENKIAEFLLYVTARDGGTISRSSSVQVKIRAPGDSRPQFLQRLFHGNVEEDQDPGVLVLKVSFLAIDPVTLQVETEVDKFSINDKGELSTLVKLDYDEGPHSYLVEISISDGISSDRATVEVQLTDINDNSPVFSSSSISKSVPEDAEVGTNVSVVPATDKDSGFNKEIRYSLGGGGEGRFTIDPVSGMVTLTGALDRETKSEYSLLVVAEDQGRPARSATASLLVRVSDVNDNVPKFSEAQYQLEVLETESTGRDLLNLSATDPDEGANGAVTYSIFQQSPSSDPAVFELDSSSGTLRLVQPLDYSEVTAYTLVVQASDGGTPSLVGNSSVVVKVKDVNNNPPEFSEESYNVAVSENLASGVSILTMEVTDRDEGGFVGALQVLPESAPFSIDSDGTIRVKNSTALDRETTETIAFQVEARETKPPHHVAMVNVNITLLDENDNSPKFTNSKYESKVSTSQTEGMLLVEVEAEDPDAGVNGQIKYSIDFGNQNDFFSIDEDSGAITLAKLIPLEAHETMEFLLFIAARDGGVVSRSASAQVNIIAVGDTKPQFTERNYVGTIEEERDPGTVIVNVSFLATGEIPVTLRVENEVDKFSINNRGELSTLVKLDYDEGPHSYLVEISISDGVSSDNATVEVQLTDINDNSPVFSSSSISKSVPEDAEVGTNVSVVPATDKDSGFNKEIRYSLGGGGEGRFTIDPVSGMVTLTGALDRETKSEYSLLVVAEDQGRPARSATGSLLVRVSDVNDNVPKFSEAQYQLEVLETESTGRGLLNLSATDPDEGANGAVTYSIFQQSPSSDPAVFELDSSSGTLRLVQPLDYSEVTAYTLVVQASDGGTPSLVGNSSVVVKVKDVNNNPPEFSEESYNVAVSENLASGASILTLEVTDKDEGGFVGALQVLPESAPFSIDSDGTIRVKNSTALDRETTETIAFQVEARETKPPHHVAMVNVNITLLDENDNSPKFTNSKYESKVSTGQTEGMLLVEVEAEDPDAGVNGQIKYSIDFGNQNDFFSIDEDSGMITLAKLIPLEAHEILEFLLLVTARDGGVVSRSASAQVNIIAVGDTKPRFTERNYVGTIEEERDPGTVIVKVSFLATGEIPVTLRVENEVDKFSINNKGELSTLVKLDYDEGPQSYFVEISISDGVSSDNATVEVQLTDINDNSPVFSSSSVSKSVPEDAEVGTNVSVVPATDKDSGFNKEIRYSLGGGGEGRFTIDPVSGMVTLTGALDRETKSEYSLLVVAEDQGRPARSATASLLVRVSDVNDNVPKFSEAQYQLEVLETESTGRDLLNLSATDPDEGANGAVTYSIFQQSPSSDPAVFELDSSSGTLRLVQPLDYSEVTAYTLVVQASDGGTPSLVGNSSVVVKVKDVNNNPPEFSEESYDVAVSENLASGASILTLEVTDKDEGGFSSGHFLFTSDTFDINKQGVVSLRKDATLDRETKDSYVLQVVAVDQASEGLRATAQLNITVLDYNDHAPQFPSIPDPVRIPEGEYSEESPGAVHTIVPTDADLGPNGEVTLSLPSPHPLFRFRADGTLLAVGPLDRESRDTYELLVQASDGGSPPRESVTTVTVSLDDVNDNRPQFSSGSYVSSVLLREAEEGKLLLTVTATDRDAGDNSLVSYSFGAGSSPYLAIDSETGAVTLTSDLADVTEDTTLDVTVLAEDHGRPPLSSTARLVVNLRVVSLVEGVGFWSSTYNFSLAENQPAGVAVGTVRASSGSDLYNVTYALKTHADLFSVDGGGVVRTRAQLDREQQEWYILDVEAVDTRSPPTSAVAMVSVQVDDVNEPPQFPSGGYEASVRSIAPYRTGVVHVKASDPDVGEDAQLVYSLATDSPYFDVEPSSGLVYVAAELSGQLAEVDLEVRATDPRGLQAGTIVKVTVLNDASSGDVVVLSLNQPAKTVEKNVPDLEKALGAALGWTVSIIQVSNGGPLESRSLRAAVKTLVSFISTDGTGVVPSEEVKRKMESQSDVVKAELDRIFGGDVDFNVVTDTQSPASDQAVVIALGVLLALSMLGLVAAVALIIRFKRTKTNPKDSDDSFDIGRKNNGYMNWSQRDSLASKEEEMTSQEKGQEDKQQRTEGQEDKQQRTEGQEDKQQKTGGQEDKQQKTGGQEEDKQQKTGGQEEDKYTKSNQFNIVLEGHGDSNTSL